MELLTNQDVIISTSTLFWLFLMFCLTVIYFFIKERFIFLYMILSVILVLTFLNLFDDNDEKNHNTLQIERSIELEGNNTPPAQVLETD